MPSRSPNSAPSDCLDLVEDDKPSLEGAWSEDSDPLPEGWEDWREEEGMPHEEQDEIDWSDLETSRPSMVVGYRSRATLLDLDDLCIDVFCDTGKPFSRLHAPLELLQIQGKVVDLVEVEGESAVALRFVLAGRETTAVIRLEEQAEDPMLVLGRDILGKGWSVDVSRGPGVSSGAASLS